MCYCDCRCDCVERRLSRLFYQYGKFIARHPIPFVVVPLIVAAALGAGLLTLTNETDPEYLFAPADSRAQSDRARLGELFPNDDATQFNSARLNNLGRFGRVIITASDGGNVLREGIFSEVIKVNDFIVDINITVDGETLRFDNDLCAKWLDQCSLNDIIGLYNFSSTNADNINITYPTTGQIFIGGALGGVAFYSDQETVKSALAIQLHYFLKSGDEELELQSDMWELEFMNSMFVYESDNIDVAYYTSQTLELELEASITSVFPLFTITFTLLITFSIVCCIMADWVRSKPMLGQLGVLSAGLAIVSSLGLMSYCGVPFINVVASMPFLILGIGVDDMFIMIAAWRKTPSKFTVEERMGHAYSEAALSITITSITDFLAFCIGAISFFPAVQIFCLYTGVAVLFDYLYQITFFGACMVLFGRREAANRHCCSCMKVLPKKESPSTTYRLFCAGGWSDKTPPDDEASEHIFVKFFRVHYGPFITKLPVKLVTMVLYAAYLSVAIWGSLHLQEGIRLKNLANDNSYATTFYDLDDNYFKVYGPIVSFTIDEEVDYSSKVVQNKLYDVIEELKENDYFHSSNSTVQFWLTEFLVFMEHNNITYSNKDQFIQILRSMFLVNPTVFDTDIQFNDANTSIVASRFLVSSSDSSTANRERNIMVESRRIADKSDIHMFAYHPAFVFYEQYIAILSNTLQNIGIAAGAMFLVSLILIPHPLCSLYVTLAIASISLGVIGYMTLWHVRLDAVAMINIIICIGFSVDFSAHITYAFVIAPHNSRNKRSVHALYLLGWPILEGALSTILGVLALSLSVSYIFRTFFKTMFLVISIGALHGLLFLPVFLTLLGPCRYPKKEEVDEIHIVDPMSSGTETKHGHRNPLIDDNMELWLKEVCSSNRSLRRISPEPIHTTTCEQ